MKNISTVLAVVATAVVVSSSASAVNLSEQFSKCMDKFADPSRGATVMLECNAADGKLSDCKVTDVPNPARGFDKAALCVAEVLPMGSRTGTVTVPIKFNPRVAEK